MKTTRASLQNQLETIGRLTGLATSRLEAEANGQDSFLALDFASVYGGYRLIKIRVSNGGEFGAFGGTGIDPRVKAPIMEQRLAGIIQGLEYAQTLQTA